MLARAVVAPLNHKANLRMEITHYGQSVAETERRNLNHYLWNSYTNVGVPIPRTHIKKRKINLYLVEKSLLFRITITYSQA